MEEKYLVAKSSFLSKKGIMCYVLQFVSKASDFNKSHGHIGERKIEQLFVDENIFNSVTDDMLEKNVIVDYSTDGYRMYISNVKVK